MCQVTTLQQVAEVIQEGADAVVVQGNESGGHGASAASTLTFVPEAVDLVQQLCKSMGRPPVPVIAAGGISDARQVPKQTMPSLIRSLPCSRCSLFTELEQYNPKQSTGSGS